MVKLRHRGLLVLGINRKELEQFNQGAPLPVTLEDLDPKLKGQVILLIPGESDGSLNKVMQSVASAYEQGATSIIEVAKSVPKLKRGH